MLGVMVGSTHEEIKYLYHKGFRVFQISLGSMSSFEDNSEVLYETYSSLLAPFNRDCTFIVHGKFGYNFVKGDYLTDRTIYSVGEQLLLCSALGVKKFVVHVGCRASLKELAKGVERSEGYCFKVWEESIRTLISDYGLTNTLDTELIFENTPGSRSNMNMGSVSNILRMVDLFPQGVGFCFDTQHAFANGEPLFFGALDGVISKASLVHLNGNSEGSKFGGHLDRHSKTPIFRSSLLGCSTLLKVYKTAKCSCILERDDMGVILEDLNFLSQVSVLDKGLIKEGSSG